MVDLSLVMLVYQRVGCVSGFYQLFSEVCPTGGAGPATVDVAMGHTAVLFRAGDRLRLQMLGESEMTRLEMLQVRKNHRKIMGNHGKMMEHDGTSRRNHGSMMI